MTNTQHTPWTMRLHLNTAEDEAFAREHGVKMTLIPALTADGSRIISGPDGQHVAYVPPVTEPKRGEGYKHIDAERDARGHLIAAAPETTAALRGLVDAITSASPTICQFCTRHTTKHGARCPLAVAVAAIAKAEGKDTAQ